MVLGWKRVRVESERFVSVRSPAAADRYPVTLGLKAERIRRVVSAAMR